MYWALLALTFDQLAAQVAVSRHWVHPEEVRLLHAVPYGLQALTSLILLSLLWRYRSAPYFLIVAGLTSNAISYIRFGFVPDYIPVGPFYSDGADLVISVGAIYLITSLLFKRAQH